MRVFNRHKANVAGIEPGETGEVDTDNAGIKVFIEAGLLVDANTISGPEREPTLDEMRAQMEHARLSFEDLRRENENLRAHVAELEAQLAAKAESAPAAEPTGTPEAPAKKGKG